MKPKTEKTLPKIFVMYSNGGIYLQRVRCGKKNCKCSRGIKHITYYYMWREGGRQRKAYIRKSDLEEIRAEVDRNTYWRNRVREKLKTGKKVIKELRARNKANKDAGIKDGFFNTEYWNQLIKKRFDESQKRPCSCPACSSQK